MKKIEEDIRTGKFRQIYLLYGEEDYLKRQYRDMLVNAMVSAGDTMNFTVFEGKEISPGAVIDLAETLPFFAERRVILIRDSGFFKQTCEELADYLAGVAPSTYFIFVETEVDKRSRMYKAVKKNGGIAEFAEQKEALLTRWILSRLKKEGKRITGPVMRLFLGRTGTDMGVIDREMEKLICYTMGRDVIEAADVEAIVTDQPENKIFDMVNAVAEHNQRKVLDYYYDLLALKEPPMRILFLIMRQFQILLCVRDLAGRGADHRTMAQTAGIPEFAVARNVSQAKGFTVAELVEVLKGGAELEEAAKQGRMNDRMAVELFLVKYSTAGVARKAAQ